MDEEKCEILVVIFFLMKLNVLSHYISHRYWGPGEDLPEVVQLEQELPRGPEQPPGRDSQYPEKLTHE